MRTKTLFNEVDASVNQTSEVLDFQQRAEWIIQLTKTGTNGTPHLIIEFSIDNIVFTPLQNTENLLYVFDINDTPFAVRDDTLQGQFFRIRLEPANNTTGTITAKIGIKTYP